MRIGYLDCVGGISGDMFVGALLDAGWPEESFRRAVAWLAPEIAELRVERRHHHALSGLGIVVVPRLAGAACDPGHRDAHAHGHDHDEGHPGHRHHPHNDHPHDPGHEVARIPATHGHGCAAQAPHAGSDVPAGGRHVPVRGLREVTACLQAAPIEAATRERALAVFARLAQAEALAHGVPVDEVHFHEVGAVDAMVDIVAACQGLRDLGIERLHVSPLPMGRGTIETAHGRIPLPAPATVNLLRGAPIRWTDGEGERTTPTGAALVMELGVWTRPPTMELEAVGVGAGSRPLEDVPNLARLFVGRQRVEQAQEHPSLEGGPGWGWGPEDPTGGCPGRWGQIVCLETLLDDASGEQIAHCARILRTTGALEVFLTPVQMKKDRPGVLLTAIARPADEERLAAILLRESGTLGVRRQQQWRRELERRGGSVATQFGPVEVKWAWRGAWQAKPEYDSCRVAAERARVPWMRVWTEAHAIASRSEPGGDCGPSS